MALPKKQLKEKLQEAGVSEEQIDGIVGWILDGHTSSIDAVKEQLEAANKNIEDLTAKTASIDGLTKERDTLQNEVNTLKKSSDKAATVQKEYDDFKASIAKRDSDAAKRTAVTSALKGAGVQRDELVDLLVGKVDFDNVEVEDGKLKDVDAFINPMKEKYASLFAETHTEGTPKAEPPTNGSSGGMTKADIMKIKDAAKRQAAIAENMELFQR